MRKDIQDFVDQTMPCQVSIRHLATMLPKDDAELDALLEEAVRNVDGRAVPYILFAALSANRKIDARHIQGSVMLITGFRNFLPLAWKLEGDVPKFLMAATRAMALEPQVQAALFFVIAAWEAEGRGATPREEAIITARMFSRGLPPASDAVLLMAAAAHLWKDEGLKDVLSVFVKPIPEEKINELVAEFLRVCKRPVLEGIAVRPDGNLTHGKTMRRSVATVGRNDPCPCGSGKKYKQCCITKDNLRLQQSTEIEGVTRAELRENLEEHINSLRLARCNPPDLQQIDPRKLARFLLKPYFERLGRFRMLDKIAESFEQLGYSDDLAETWEMMMYWAHHYRRKDVAERLLKLVPAPYETEKSLYAGYRLLLYEDRPTKMMEILLEQAEITLLGEMPDTLQSFALALLPTKLSAVGILVARGVLPFLSDEDARIVYSEILRARDLLNLPADDLYTDIMDERLTKKKENEPDDAEVLNEAKRKLEEKAKEVRQMKETLHQLQRELSLRENKMAPAIAENIVQLPGVVDDAAVAELRTKLESVKTELKERHNERNELRRELQKAHDDIEQLRQIPSIASENEQARAKNEEDALLLPEENVGQQPVRLIEFPKKFEERLASFPRHVARNAMKTLGELAGGETSAFAGAVRLKAIPSITRQRIGIDVRLLFKVLPDRLQVVDLVNRKDLERRIKSLLNSPH
jgi:hypothetical protein